MSDFAKTYHLLCPGPVNVHPAVQTAMSSAAICHREEEFSALLALTRSRALAVAEVADDAYAAMVVTGSGTAGNEAVLSSVVPPEGRVLVIVNGEFGERLGRISEVYQHTDLLQHAWGEPVDSERLATALRDGAYDLVAMVHHETSTGVLNPVDTVGKLCHMHGVRLFLDMVSSYSADPVDLAAAHVSFATTSSGKAIAAFPGLALVFGRIDALEALETVPVRNHYLNLYRHYRFATDVEQTPNTPALPLILALNKALELALVDGVSVRHARQAELADHVRRAVKARGMDLLIADQPLSNVLTTVRLPEGVPFEPFRTALRERGFVIYGGKGPFKDHVFQVSTISDVDEALLDSFFAALDEVIAALRPKVAAVA